MRSVLRAHLLASSVVIALAGCGPPAPVVAPSPPGSTVTPAASASPAPVPPASPAPVPSAIPTPPNPVGIGCHFRGLLPDPACTPGALNPAVTQGSIHQTICVSGYTTTIRPPVTESNRLKHLTATAYGVTDPISNYEGDHLISLELGGAPDDIANFWDETHATSYAKDELENYLNRAVCSGRTSLADAQHAIATDWAGAYCAARLPRCSDGANFR